MPRLQDQVADVYNDYNVAALPVSGAKKPPKSGIRTLLYGVLSAIDNVVITAAIASGAVVFYATKTLMDADLTHIAGTLAIVKDDPTDTNNGIYVKTGGSGSGAWSNTGLVTMASIRGRLDLLETTKAEVDELFIEMTAALNTVLTKAAQVAANAAQVAIDKDIVAYNALISTQQAALASSRATSAMNYRDAAQVAEVAAEEARDQALAALHLANIYKWYNTKALATADLAGIPANNYIGVWADESRVDSPRTYYQKVGGVLTFILEDPKGIDKKVFAADLPAAGITKDTLLPLMAQSRYVRVDSTIHMPNTDVLDGIINSTMIGDGMVLGIAGKYVVPTRAPPASLNVDGNCRPDHFPHFNSASKHALILVGDSLMSPNHNNNFVYSDSLAGVLHRQFMEQVGGEDLVVLNRAIGGAGYTNFLFGRDDTFPTWWTDHGETWIATVNAEIEALQADGYGVAVGLGFGMNPDTNIFWAMLNIISALADNVDPFFCTNLLPSLNPTNSTAASQYTRLSQQSMTRHFALFYDYALVDIGRMGIMARDGYDPRSCIPYENFANTNPTGFVVAPIGTMSIIDGEAKPFRPVDGGASVVVKCTDFIWTMEFSRAEWDTTAFNGVWIPIGSGPHDRVEIIKNPAGKLDIFVRHGDTITGRLTTASVEDWDPADSNPAGTITIVTEVTDNIVMVRAVEKDADGGLGRYTDPILATKTLRFAVPFIPTVTTVGDGRPLTRARFDLGLPQCYMPTITNTEAWGTSTSDFPHEGTGDNHNTNLLVARVHRPVIEQCVFASPGGGGSVPGIHTDVHDVILTPVTSPGAVRGDTLTGRTIFNFTGSGSGSNPDNAFLTVNSQDLYCQVSSDSGWLYFSGLNGAKFEMSPSSSIAFNLDKSRDVATARRYNIGHVGGFTGDGLGPYYAGIQYQLGELVTIASVGDFPTAVDYWDFSGNTDPTTKSYTREIGSAYEQRFKVGGLKLRIGATLGFGATALPETDNAYNLGSSSFRFGTIYAATGTINTSDIRTKADIRSIGEALGGADVIDFIRSITPIAYRFDDDGFDVEQRLTGHEEVEVPASMEAIMGPDPEKPGEVIQIGEREITGAHTQRREIFETILHPRVGRRIHLGFSAQDFEPHARANDLALWTLDNPDDWQSRQGLRPSEIIPILWQGLSDLAGEVRNLQQQLAAKPRSKGPKT